MDRGRLRNNCKQCHKEAVCARQKANPEKFNEYQREYARLNAERKAAATRVWREANPERQKAACLAWRKANPERERAQKRAYRAANREKIAAWFRERYLAHAEEAAAYNRVYRAANRERVRQWGRQGAAVRKARKAGAVVGKADYRAILVEHGMVCHICGEDIQTVADLHFDHVIPLAKGGSHSPDNISPAHALCNQRKGTRI